MPTVLVADGDGELREIFVDFLTSRGMQVETAGDGLECVAKVRDNVPDLIILDAELLWGGGDGVLDWLRYEWPGAPIPVILTATARIAPVIEPPIVAFLPKPFALAPLLEKVRDAMAARRPKPGILVVDDNDAIRAMVVATLTRNGFEVWAESNGHDAIFRYRDHADRIDVVLLDVCMAGLNGPQTLDALREMNSAVVACFMSGNLGPYRREDLTITRAATRVFDKPFHLDELVNTLRMLATRRTGE